VHGYDDEEEFTYVINRGIHLLYFYNIGIIVIT